MSIIINLLCFSVGSIFGVFIMCAMAMASKADEEMGIK